MIQEDDCANAVPHGIPYLYRNFHTAATILRLHRSRLLEAAKESKGPLLDFFQLLDRIELTLPTIQKTHPKPFLIVVEGLDGSGKSSLVQSLAAALSEEDAVLATGTPPQSLRKVRPVFDRIGGSVARAFYMVSNYVLQYEILLRKPNHKIVIVDRYYASTCAYSVAKFLSSSSKPMESLEELWDMPKDLMAPHLQLVLSVDHEVRAQRTIQRNAATIVEQTNDWDERLARDRKMADDIQYGLQKIRGPRWNITVDANPPAEIVSAEALRIVREKWELSKSLASRLRTQLASIPTVSLVSNSDESLFPCISQAKVLAMNDSGIYGMINGTIPRTEWLGTILWQHDESEWKIQAAFAKITRKHLGVWCETDIDQGSQYVLFHGSFLEMECTESGDTTTECRHSLPGTWIPRARPMTIAIFGTHCAGKSTIAKDLAELLNWSFDPELGDILRGESVVANGHKVGDGSGHVVKDWDTLIYDAELQRDNEHSSIHRVVESWHVGNYGWACVRLHEGNAMANGSDEKETLAQRYRRDEKERMAHRYRTAIEKACQQGTVLLINLKVSAETSLRRRQNDERNRKRFPLVDEMAECESIHEFLQTETSEFAKTLKSFAPNVQTVEVANDTDGPDEAHATLQTILAILDSQRWRSWIGP